MKNFIIKNIVLTFVSLALLVTPLYVFATDRWNETADFSHDPKSDAAVYGPGRFNYTAPEIGSWDETPDLSLDRQSNDDGMDSASGHIDRIDENMYVETPELS